MLRTSGRFFFGHLANILSGKTSEAIERHGHDQLKTFGVGADRAPAEWRGVLRQLLSARLIEHDGADRDRLDRHRGGAQGAARRGAVRPARGRRRQEDATRQARGGRRAPGDADAELLAALKALRGALAKAQKQPAYVVFPDRSLIEMAAARPRSLDELGRVHGVGAAKLARYGSAFLAVIRERADA